MKKQLFGDESGFTLLEIIIVIAIMLIVMQIVFLSTSYFVDNKAEQSVENMDRNVNNALLTYYGITGGFPDITGIDVGRRYDNVNQNVAEAMVLKLQQVTGITVSKDYSYGNFMMDIDYVNSYVMKITFETR